MTIAFNYKNDNTTVLEVLSMIGSIHISLIAFNQLKLVQRFLLAHYDLWRPLRAFIIPLVRQRLTFCFCRGEKTKGTPDRRLVNVLCGSSDNLSFYLFADDTNLLYADRDVNFIKKVVNSE